MGLHWQASFSIIVLLYFYSHYFFASGKESGYCESIHLDGGSG